MQTINIKISCSAAPGWQRLYSGPMLTCPLGWASISIIGSGEVCAQQKSAELHWCPGLMCVRSVPRKHNVLAAALQLPCMSAGWHCAAAAVAIVAAFLRLAGFGCYVSSIATQPVCLHLHYSRNSCLHTQGRHHCSFVVSKFCCKHYSRLHSLGFISLRQQSCSPVPWAAQGRSTAGMPSGLAYYAPHYHHEGHYAMHGMHEETSGMEGEQSQLCALVCCCTC